MAQIWTDCEGHTRRDMLQIGTAGLLGLSLPSILKLEAQATDTANGPRARATSVILVWLGGGPATIDMWDLKPGAPAEIRGEFNPINTRAPGVQISEHLPRMAGVADKVTIVRSLAHTIPSHGPATQFMTTGNKPSAAVQFPSMGALASRLLTVDRGIPPYVAFNNVTSTSGYLGTAYNPFMVESTANPRTPNVPAFRLRGVQLPTGFTLDDLANRDRLLQGFDQGLRGLDRSTDIVDGLDTFHRQALEILRSDRTIRAFDLSQETQTTRDAYGSTSFGQGALAARRLIEAGVRFTTISLGGWDLHSNNFTTLANRNLPQLDQVLATLIRDLDERGILDSTVVMCAGEFNRTPRINRTAGRDHWARSMASVIAGGGFRRGYVHGSTDAQGMAPATEPVTPDDISATIFHALGIDPHMELNTPTGRPMQLFREGRVVERMLG